MPSTPGKRRHARTNSKEMLRISPKRYKDLRRPSDGIPLEEAETLPSTGGTPPALEDHFPLLSGSQSPATPESRPSQSPSLAFWSQKAIGERRSPSEARARRAEEAGKRRSSRLSETITVYSDICAGDQNTPRKSSLSHSHPEGPSEHAAKAVQQYVSESERHLSIRQTKKSNIPFSDNGNAKEQGIHGRSGDAGHKLDIITQSLMTSLCTSPVVLTGSTLKQLKPDIVTLDIGPGPAPFRNASGVPLQQNPQGRSSQINAPRLTNGKLGTILLKVANTCC